MEIIITENCGKIHHRNCKFNRNRRKKFSEARKRGAYENKKMRNRAVERIRTED